MAASNRVRKDGATITFNVLGYTFITLVALI